MKAKTALFASALLMVGANAGAASIYKCTDEKGRTVYSQQRCAPDADRVTVEVAPAAPVDHSAVRAEYQAVTDRLTDQMTNVKIRNAQNRITVLANERDDLILGYRKEMMRSAYNSAGVSRSIKYQELIDATRESYASQIAAKRAEIAALRLQLKN